ncbi:hypothetical protein [Kitasatospora aureofaciens]|uniref:hypothetical protein n=1 Tax=Kitasatospora aureofaciens TaxID=1894 RepID=UPI0033DCD72F
MLHNLLASAGAVPYLALATALAIPLRLLALLTGFLTALRGTRGPSRDRMFDAFARCLMARPRRLRR